MTIELKTKPRSLEKHSDVRRDREAGNIPAVVYGYGVANTNVNVDGIELIKTLRENGRNAVLTITLDGKKTNVVLHAYQKHPLHGNLVHVDLLAVNMKEELETAVSIRLVGEPKAKAGVVEQVLYEVSISATPANVPEALELDVSHLEIGDTLTVADLTVGKKYTILADGEDAVVNLQAPKAIDEPIEGPADIPEPEAIHGADEEKD